MAEKTGQFKGIKQVLFETYSNAVKAKTAAGYLWFVRQSSGDTNGDIYFGTRHYGHFNEDEIKKLTLEEDITTMGVSVGTLSNGSKLAKGASLTDVLKQILIKEIDVVATKPTVSLSMAGALNGGNYEVGSELSITLTPEFTDGVFKSAESQYSYDQAAGCVSGETTYYRDNAAIESNVDALTVGAEKTYSYKCATAYGASTVTPKKNNGAASSVKIVAGNCTSGAQTVNGKFYGYVGYSEKTDAAAFETADIKGLNAVKKFLNGKTEMVGATSIKSNGKSIVVAFPSTYKFVSATNGVGADIKPNFKNEAIVNYVNGNITTSYKVYVYPITNGAEVEYKNLVISK